MLGHVGPPWCGSRPLRALGYPPRHPRTGAKLGLARALTPTHQYQPSLVSNSSPACLSHSRSSARRSARSWSLSLRRVVVATRYPPISVARPGGRPFHDPKPPQAQHLGADSLQLRRGEPVTTPRSKKIREGLRFRDRSQPAPSEREASVSRGVAPAFGDEQVALQRSESGPAFVPAVVPRLRHPAPRCSYSPCGCERRADTLCATQVGASVMLIGRNPPAVHGVRWWIAQRTPARLSVRAVPSPRDHVSLHGTAPTIIRCPCPGRIWPPRFVSVGCNPRRVAGN